MACGAELDSSQLPANIPCAQPIIKLLKLIWFVLELLAVAFFRRVSASTIPCHPHSYACLQTRRTQLFSLPLNPFFFRSKSDLTLEELSQNSFFSGVSLKDETSAVKFEPDCKKCRTSLLPACVFPPSHAYQAFKAGS